MILSGVKDSYYDEYTRKKSTGGNVLNLYQYQLCYYNNIGRVITCDPPSLLTDRGAYVNFLEVNQIILLYLLIKNYRFN